ncbi:MAG TPA: ATP-binding protein [Xanthomonadaceae bacterium]|nr:ATP-binding protein [Xanthomonadaceae bacterium]
MALEAIRPIAESRRQRIVVEGPAAPLFVEADPARLVQVFGNLLNNACKFGPEAGHVFIQVASQDGMALVRVRDEGVGIAAEQLPRIFEMFAQVEEPLVRANGGLGIGLALVRGLVEMHGGSVTAHSDGPGQGSEFVVRLPLSGG